MKISKNQIKKLREETGAGVIECKNALEQASGDFKKAIEILKKRGVIVQKEKASRKPTCGIIDSYIHPDGRIGILIEVACETDFVARNPEFKSLVHDLAMQIAALNPQYLSPEGLNKNIDPSLCLLTQPFIKNPEMQVSELINSKISQFGENIQVKRFTRYEIKK